MMPDKLVLKGDPPSSKSRVKVPEALKNLLKRYNRSEIFSQLKVCDNRKVVWVLDEGELNSLSCFSWNEIPTASYRTKKNAENKGTEMIP